MAARAAGRSRLGRMHEQGTNPRRGSCRGPDSCLGAATRQSLVQAQVLERTVARRTPPLRAGVELENLQVAQEVLARIPLPVVEVASVHVARLSLGFPGWAQPLRLRLAGLHVGLRQRQLPQVRRAAWRCCPFAPAPSCHPQAGSCSQRLRTSDRRCSCLRQRMSTSAVAAPEASATRAVCICAGAGCWGGRAG